METYFKRVKNKRTGKEELLNLCRTCEKEQEYKKHCDGDKLICLICGESKDQSEFDYHQDYKIRNHKDGRCHLCKLE